MPEKPRIHPVKVFVVNPVYVIISSLIFRRPYEEGNPFVLVTVIIPDVESILLTREVDPTITSGVKLSRFKY